MALFDRLFNRPHQSYTDVEDDRQVPNNPNGREFMDVVKHSIGKTVEKFSVAANSLVVGDNHYSRGGMPFGSAGALVGNTNVDMMTGFSNSKLGLSIPVDTNKMARIQSYDNIARYPELDWCIDEIANDFLHKDIDGDYIKLKLNVLDDKFKDGEETVIQEEFKHMVAQYDLDTVGFNMIRKFLIEGEVCFENVIDTEHPEYGIIGFKYVPTVFYDFLRNRDTGQLEGICLDPERIKTYAEFSSYGGNAYTGPNSQIFNAIRQVPAYSYTYSMDTRNKIVMPFEQVTYMNSGKLSEDGAVVFPPIEKVVVPTRQLLLMHDAIVIYRITRAPEKLVFNIDMAGMPSKKVRELVRRMAADHKARKAVQGSGAVTNVYNAETMLDAYYFWKTGESQGTQVTSLAGTSTAHYNELNDVEYFLKRILKFLNIPWSRWSESQANRQDKNSIQNEEYSFAQSIVRYQTLFAAAVKKTFITHLRLKGIFDKYDLHESEFEVSMNPPSLFEIYQQQNRFSDALDIISKVAQLEFMSKNIVIKKVLNWTDEEIHENEVEVRREALRKAQNDWAVQQLGTGAGGGQIWLDASKYLAQPAGQPPVTEGDPNAQPPQDNSGTTAAEVQMPPNPEFGDFNDANASNKRESAKLYPENSLGVKKLRIGKTSMEDVFDNQFGDNPHTYGSMTDRFNQLFDDRAKEPIKGSMSDVFDKEFNKNRNLSSDFSSNRKLTSTFNDVFNDGEHESELKDGENAETLTDVFRNEFLKKPSENKPEGDTLSDVFDAEFGKNKKNKEENVENFSLTKVFDDKFGTVKDDDNSKYIKTSKLTNAFDYVFGKDSVNDVDNNSGEDNTANEPMKASSDNMAHDLNDAMAKMFAFED
jgi:hypothetical protein